ncbi:S46 family peptidase [Aestuariibacter halophilus]|uniref:Dipeptidyl-peptidase n=1 Tax=Fluctibacter halophilus TaxID=226011 RepID=A0ABS8GCM1_9ALTE|nr:S46 family peptidase [Aestuariibacter halophilus]MCC2618011.1 S46 family peptidase [Aestuariibacter halophilus]
MFKPAIALLTLLCSGFAAADEGMWQPHQLKDLAQTLSDKGLNLDPDKMQNLDQFPMNAIISLGGCTASFVSPKGLALTNHHCAYGSIQYNSTEQNNLLENGFVAKTLADELPAAPGSRIYVTESLTDVTDKVSGAVHSALQGEAYQQAIEANEKALVAACETSQDYRCEVFSYHGGASYFLIKLLAIRDVRLVYAPPSSIGKFGGDTDNWMWPRHTGDWSYYRAYVGKDGKPADYSEDNVPYTPKAHLKVNAGGVSADDFVMVLGYPGRTNRYRTPVEVSNQFNWVYPTAKRYREEYIDVIKAVAPKGSDARIKYESTIAGLANYAKNYGSMITSYQQGDMQARKAELNRQLKAWIAADPKRQKAYGESLDQLDRLVEKGNAMQARDLVMGYMGRTAMWNVAKELVKLAHERSKPDAERNPGYQERDMNRFKQKMERVNRRFDASVDTEVLVHFIQEYLSLDSSQRVPAFDTFFGLNDGFDEAALREKIATMHANTELDDTDTRLALMNADFAALKASDDPFIRFAVALFDHDQAVEAQDKALEGELLKARPAYMQALIAYKQSRNEAVYADANSSLRITYGNVKGYSPKDGMMALPFTTLEGQLAKYIPGDEEFDLPASVRSHIQDKDYGPYANPELGSVAVNFLSTVDTTGGNSGSPTLNGDGELVGLLFDGVYESVIGDWDYDPNLNRSIHVSTPYMLWVMDKIDGAHNLLEEMTIVE